MKKRFLKIWMVAIFFGFLISPKTYFAQESSSSSSKNSNTSTSSDVEDRKKRLAEIEAGMRKLEDEILTTSQNKKSVQDEITIIEKSIEKTSLDIEATNENIDLKNLQIGELEKEIEVKILEIDKKKEFLNEVAGSYLKVAKPSALDILLGDETLSTFVSKSKNLEKLQNQIISMLEKLNSEKANLESDQRNLKFELNSLENLIEQQKDLIYSLEQQNSSKKIILQDLSGNESEYQKLLAEARGDYESLRVEILQLEEARLNGITKKPTTREISAKLIWPVSGRKITAYFMDPDYKKYFGVNHYAIDISQVQGSPVYASSDGRVVKVRDAGMGYNYLMIQHEDNVSTVYGHVSKFKVAEGDLVEKGQIIALSGGAPGTPGAGRMTTGAHMHFEVIVDGEHVNPLIYLPKE
ncbi:MAG: M23 family metallopeptidase [Patescibacteria group bacterium]